MRLNSFTVKFILAISCLTVFALGRPSRSQSPPAPASARVFEIRTYTAEDGKLDALNARFRDHTTKLFEKHGITSIGYWIPADEPRSKNTLIYIVAHPSREAAKQNWDEFGKDPEWQKAKAESEADGKLVTKVESVYVNPTDYSPLK
jgi:hypothetical protein